MAKNIVSGGINTLLFFAGLEIQHNIFGDNTSSPQTTELRIGGAEGGGAAEGTLMKWVHIATAKGLGLTAVVGLVSGNWFAFLGALVGSFDMQATYWYAKRCGRRLKNGGSVTDAVNAGNQTGFPYANRSPSMTGPVSSVPLRMRP